MKLATHCSSPATAALSMPQEPDYAAGYRIFSIETMPRVCSAGERVGNLIGRRVRAETTTMQSANRRVSNGVDG